MEKEFLELCEKINVCKNTKELYEMLEGWKVEPTKINDWVEIILNNLYKISPQVLPYVIECLYASENKIKFFFSNMLLEECHETIPFVTNLESIRISKEKFELLLPTLVKVAKNSYNGVADCMYLILLNNDPSGVFLSAEQRETIIASVEDKLPMLYKYISENKEVPPEVYNALEIILDVASNFTSSKIKEELLKINKLNNLNEMSKLFAIKACLVNEIEYNKNFVVNLAKDRLYCIRLFGILNRIDKKEVFPNEYLNQERFAMADMLDWLNYPTELGENPKEIELIGKFEEDEEVFYVYKFNTDNDSFKDKGYMIGISGGYNKNIISNESSGFTFSNFETIKADYIEQAKEIVNHIKQCWKEQAEKYKK